MSEQLEKPAATSRIETDPDEQVQTAVCDADVTPAQIHDWFSVDEDDDATAQTHSTTRADTDTTAASAAVEQTITNLHATAKLGCELDLVALAEDIPAVDVAQTRQHNEMRLTVELFDTAGGCDGHSSAGQGQGQSTAQQQLGDFLDEQESGCTAHVRVYRSGKMCLTGVTTPADIDAAYRRVVHLLDGLGVPIDPEPPEISNIVASVDVGTAVNLEHLMVDIGLEDCEYDPIGFPGLVTNFGATTVIVFHSGSVTVAGASTLSEFIDGVGRLQSFMADLQR